VVLGTGRKHKTDVRGAHGHGRHVRCDGWGVVPSGWGWRTHHRSVGRVGMWGRGSNHGIASPCTSPRDGHRHSLSDGGHGHRPGVGQDVRHLHVRQQLGGDLRQQGPGHRRSSVHAQVSTRHELPGVKDSGEQNRGKEGPGWVHGINCTPLAVRKEQQRKLEPGPGAGEAHTSTSRMGTNCTMSRRAIRPLEDRRLLSPSRTSIWVKSALPTPTIRMDRGSSDAPMMASMVLSTSLMTPGRQTNETNGAGGAGGPRGQTSRSEAAQREGLRGVGVVLVVVGRVCVIRAPTLRLPPPQRTKNSTISDDEQYKVLLVALVHAGGGSSCGSLLNDLGEQGWT
jgi:hypothetical protein